MIPQCWTDALCQSRADKRKSAIGVEYGVPQRGEKESVVDIEPLLVGLTLRPRHNVRCTQEIGVCDSGQWTTSAPVSKQRLAEDVLTDPLNDQSFGFCRAWQITNGGLESLEGCVGKTHAELVRSIKYIVQYAKSIETEGRGARSGHIENQ
jgi:hypothetical protein